ncbi:EAL domain-containing protein [Pelagibacterium sp. H642]|uniref:putative bifunctional diguanylate cyclase/phosphodiesterase n=1 Tax=Pelagibacterium sp. H642 TaxID=1881069 RepID=UPI0028163A7D|nr:EAL domain-containing protein [Pelagibacterium sp. H642]WMT92603.1 EAL domain-containing protein [Pelagibacterium sp. H642]
MARHSLWAQRSRFKILRIALSIGVIAFICAAGYIGTLLLQRQQALDPLGRGNVTWLVAQAPSEYAKLEQRIGAYGMGFNAIDAQEVQLRFDIVVNRLNALHSDFLAEFIASDVRNRNTVAELERVVDAARPLIENLDDPGTATQLLELLAPLYSDLVRLSVDANAWNAARVNAERDDLFRLQWVFAWVAVGLIVCGLIFIGLLLFNNILLARAHEQLRRKEDALQTQFHWFEAALNNMSQALCLTDAQQRLLVCNGRFLDVFGLDTQRTGQGASLADLLPAHLLPGWRNEQVPPSTLVGDDNMRAVDEHNHLMDDGTILYVSHQPLPGGGWVSTFEDITERQQAQNRIAHMAHFDSLTDLPNRVLFWKRTAHAIDQMGADQRPFAILYLDLDRFKEVNDTLGHPIGDALLRAVANRLKSAATISELVARLGGDEFAILHVPQKDTPLDVPSMAERLLKSVSQPYIIDGKEISLTTSIGYACAPEDGTSSETLIKKADLALYRAKEQGANTYRRFDPQMEEKLLRKRGLENDLRKAIELDQLQLHYQPLICLSTMKITAGEALLRWDHPVHGAISPAEFIPLAEETGYINSLGEWVLQRAFQEAARWPEGMRISVNLSPMQFRDVTLYDRLASALLTSGLPAERVEVEITESVLLQHSKANEETLRRFRKLGISIVLDDFGTGYSSLNYLLSFPFDKIKIDQSFVRGLPSRSDSFAIVQSIASLAKRLKIATTAEGVETVEQLHLVREAGCTQAQGYYLSRPVPASKFRSLVCTHTPRSIATFSDR